MKKRYTLENDYLFKKIFSNELYLKQLLLDLFDIKAQNICYLNTELVKSNKNNKVGIVDLLLNIDDEIVILELQNIDRRNFKERLLFYSSNIITNYCLSKNEDYNKLRSIKVYAIINYSLFDTGIKNEVQLKVKEEIFTNKLEYQIFDLTKVDKNNKENKYYELVNLFNCDNLNELDQIIKNKIYKEMLDLIKKYNLDREEYSKMKDIEELMMNETEHYDTAYEVGIEVGKKEGIEVGLERGKKEGISQGISQNKIKTAKSMLTENLDISLISKITGLSREQISSLN